MSITYLNPLTILRPLALAGAVALNELPNSKQYAHLITRLLLLEDRTREMNSTPSMPSGERMAIVIGWRAIYLEMQDALVDAGLVTNAPQRVVTMSAETEGERCLT